MSLVSLSESTQSGLPGKCVVFSNGCPAQLSLAYATALFGGDPLGLNVAPILTEFENLWSPFII